MSDPKNNAFGFYNSPIPYDELDCNFCEGSVCMCLSKEEGEEQARIDDFEFERENGSYVMTKD